MCCNSGHGLTNPHTLFCQVPEEQVKEVSDYCRETLEKINKSRLSGDYHEVMAAVVKDSNV